jgi:hypothetical protein
MIDPFFDFGFKTVWSLTTIVVVDGLCPVMEYSTLNKFSLRNGSLHTFIISIGK